MVGRFFGEKPVRCRGSIDAREIRAPGLLGSHWTVRTDRARAEIIDTPGGECNCDHTWAVNIRAFCYPERAMINENAVVA